MLPTNPYGTTTEPVETRTVEQAVIDGSVVSETVDVLLINPATGARSPLMGSRRANDRGGGGLSVHTRADCPA